MAGVLGECRRNIRPHSFPFFCWELDCTVRRFEGDQSAQRFEVAALFGGMAEIKHRGNVGSHGSGLSHCGSINVP